MTDTARDKAARLLKKSLMGGAGSNSSSSEYNVRRHKKAGSVSTHSYAEEHSVRDAPLRSSAKVENTYQMEPCKTFPSGQVEVIVKKLLEEYLVHEQYKPELCRQMSKSLSEVIRARVKNLLIPRYKVICLVHIGQLGDQCMRIGSRCLWDPAFDTFATYEFKNSSLFAVCTVYAIYAE